MASNSLRDWRSRRSRDLDEMENAHTSIGGTGRGRRYATQQLNQAYAMMIASQFQGFCRDLHTESVTAFVEFINPPSLVTEIVRKRFVDGRQLESKNAQPGSLGSDFGWFGVEFWNDVNRLLADDKASQKELDIFNEWRNAIVHHNFKTVSPGVAPRLSLHQVRSWRRLCNKLARAFDHVMREYLQSLSGRAPWPA